MRFIQKVLGLKFNKEKEWFKEYIIEDGLASKYELDAQGLIIEDEIWPEEDSKDDLVVSGPSQVVATIFLAPATFRHDRDTVFHVLVVF